MKDMIYLLLDILTYCAQGALLGMLLDTAQARFPFPEYMKKGILLLQYAVVQIFLHESGWVRNLFYENSVVNDSRQSIWPVLASMLVTCVVSGILLRENRLKLFYGIVTFYSVTELLKMAFHPVLLWVLRKLVDLNDYLFLKKQLYGEEMFYAAVSGIEIFWNILLAGTVLIFSYEILRRVKKYLALKEVHERSQLIFLLFPSLIGFLLCLMLRSMMFSMDGTDMYLLLDSRSVYIGTGSWKWNSISGDEPSDPLRVLAVCPHDPAGGKNAAEADRRKQPQNRGQCISGPDPGNGTAYRGHRESVCRDPGHAA